MNQQNILDLAREGDASAIASLLNQALGSENVWADVARQADCLYVYLTGAQVPDQDRYAHTVRTALLCLGLDVIQSVQISGQQVGDEAPAWQQDFMLTPIVASAQGAQLAKRNAKKPNAARRTAVPQRSKNKIRRFGILAAIALSFVLGTGFSGFLNMQRVNLNFARTDSSYAKSAPDLAAVSPPPETLEPSPPPSLKEDTTLTADIPYIGRATPPPQADPSPAATPTPAATTSPEVAPTPAATASPQATPSPKASSTPAATASPQATPSPKASSTPVAVVSPAATEDSILIKAVGDIIPGTNFPNYRLPEDVQYLFSGIKPYLGNADLVFGNFESTLTDYPHSAKDISQGMTFAFRTPPDYAGLLKEAGFDVLSVANNHSFDFHEEGFNDTIANIEQAGMKAVGRKGQIVYTEVKGTPVAFVGFSYLDAHNSMHDLEATAALIQEAKQNADIVVVSVHAGAEGTDAIYTRNETEYFYSENRGNLVEFAHAAIDQGADLVLGHGPHVPRAMELYQGKLIAYSLGNFMGYRTLSTVGALGVSMILQVQLDKQGDFQAGRVIPVALDANGVPYLDDYFQSVSLVRVLTASDFPSTPLLIDDMGYILRTDE